MATRILVVDDLKAWRVSAGLILNRNSFFRIIGEACDGIEAIEKAGTLRPDVVLLDIGMPRLNGIAAAKQIREICPESRIIFFTQESNDDVRSAALETGADAYVLKSEAASELVLAIDRVMECGRREPQRSELEIESAVLSPEP